MAYANTQDNRVHILGDMVMITGTFTDGGTQYDFTDQLTEVFAAGGHLTSVTGTGVTINNVPTGYSTGETGAMTVATVDARAVFTVGQTIYDGTGAKAGVITAIGGATSITVAGGIETDLPHLGELFVLGASKPSITLKSTSVDVSIDETNTLVLFEVGKTDETDTKSPADGRWWILGKR